MEVIADGSGDGIALPFTASLARNASFASVFATLGHREGDRALLVDDDKIQWSGPSGVIHLATNSDIQLTY